MSDGEEKGYVILSTYQRMGKDVEDELAKKKGLVPRATSVRGQKGPLHKAAELGNAEEVERLLNDEGCDVSQRCEVAAPRRFPLPYRAGPQGGWTALHYAGCKGYVDVMTILLKRGIDTEVRDTVRLATLTPYRGLAPRIAPQRPTLLHSRRGCSPYPAFAGL